MRRRDMLIMINREGNDCMRLDIQMNVYHDFFAVKRDFFDSFGNGRDINV